MSYLTHIYIPPCYQIRIFEHTKNETRSHCKFILSLYIPVVKDKHTSTYILVYMGKAKVEPTSQAKYVTPNLENPKETILLINRKHISYSLASRYQTQPEQ